MVCLGETLTLRQDALKMEPFVLESMWMNLARALHSSARMAKSFHCPNQTLTRLSVARLVVLIFVSRVQRLSTSSQ